jgi:phage terminase large subunit GpA-like protein
MLINGEPARGYDEEYFKGLTAERRVVKAKHGFRTYMWIKRLSQRNEPFDCRNYALGALRIPWQGIDLEKMKRDVWSAADRKAEQAQQSKFGVQRQQPSFPDQQPSGGPPPPQHQARAGRFGAQNGPIW